MPSEPLYPFIQYLKKVEAAGIYDVRRAWQRTGQTLNDFEDDSFLISADIYYDYWDQLVDEPTFAQNVVEIAKHAAHSPLLSQIQLLICAPNLVTAMERLQHFPPLTSPVHTYPEWRGKDFCLLPTDTKTHRLLPEPLLQFLCVFFYEIHGLCTLKTTRPTWVTMSKTIDNWEAIEDAIGVKIHENPRPVIAYAHDVAHLPFITHNEILWDGFLSSFKNRISNDQKLQSVTSQVKLELTASLSFGLCDIDTICQKLNMSKRSLQRKLEHENTRFQDIITDVRREQSFHYLKYSDLSISEIAYRLGYSDSAAFSRAFKAWNGTSPSTFRKN